MKKTLVFFTAATLLAANASYAESDCRTRRMQGDWTAMVLGTFPDDTRNFVVVEATMVVCDLGINDRGQVRGNCMSTTDDSAVSQNEINVPITGTIWVGRRSCETRISLNFEAFSVEVEGRANGSRGGAPDTVQGIAFIDLSETAVGTQWPMSFHMTRQPGAGTMLDLGAIYPPLE
jgi:hypothetical protein